MSSSKAFVWAIDEDGKPCKCYAKPENRGKRNCKHRFHQEPGESAKDFFEKHKMRTTPEAPADESISQDEIDDYATKIDEICGTHVTPENYAEVIESLTPEQLDSLNKLGFDAAPKFSLPITDESFEEVNLSNKIYFSELPNYGIGGKVKAMNDMFGSVGDVPVYGGETSNISSNYKTGLNSKEYFEKQFGVRGSEVQKTRLVSDPGYTARLLFYGLSDISVIEDCGNAESDGIMHCKAPGICKCCAAKSGLKVEAGDLAGAIVSTHMTEGLTQASLSAIHTGTGKKQDWEIISDTLKAYSTSPVIKKAREEKTTEGARRAIFEGLKEAYSNAGIEIDDYNLEVVAKQLTSYKTDENGRLRHVREGELCDLPSIKTIGGHNNLFLQSQLSSSYKSLARPQVFSNEENAVSRISG